MKKWIAILLVIISGYVFSGCKENPDPNLEKKPTSIEITNVKSVILIDEEVQLASSVKPATASQDVVWSSENNEIITVDQTGKIKGISVGEADITVTSKSHPNVRKTVTITVDAPIVYDDPTSVEIIGRSAEVHMESFITLTATVSPLTASQEVLWFSSDESIATVEANGKVRGLAMGEVTITVKVVADDTITDTYEVIVVEKLNPDIVEENPESIIIEGENSVIEGRTIVLTASVFPAGVSQNVLWSSSDESVAVIDSQGVITAIKQGSTYITCTSAKDTMISEVHQVTVKGKPSDLPFPNLNGYEIKIMVSSGHAYDHDPFDDRYIIVDKQAKQEAWNFVEEKFNCDINVVEYPTDAPWGPARYNWLIQKASTNSAEADIVVTTYEWLKQLVDGNAVVEVSDYYDYYGENQMHAAMKNATTYKGGLYGLLYNNVGALNVDKGIYYNKALVDSLGLDSPAKLFNEGKWTYEGFKTYVREAAALMGENQTVFSGKPVLYWIGMVNAAGVKVVDTLTRKINFDHQYAIQAATVMRELYEDVSWGTPGWDAMATTFNEGNSIFQAAEFWFIRSDDRWSAKIWDANGNSKFGYVPFPYPDNINKDNTRTSFSYVIQSGDGHCYMLSNGRQYPTGITSENIYRAFTTLMLKTGDILKDDPEFDEVTKMRQQAEKQLDDPESVVAMSFFTREKVIFDPVYNIIPYATQLSPALDQVIFDGADYFEVMNALIPVYEAQLSGLYS